MERSESIKELATALSLAQGTMGFAKMDTMNPFFHSKYADMGAVISAIKQPFKDNGLSVIQPISGDGATVTITTVLMHSSGEWISTEITMPYSEVKGKTLVQELGSIITYLRRYSLASMTGVYSDQDTDGNNPDQGKEEKRSEKITKSAVEKTPPNETQVKIVEWCKKLGGEKNTALMTLLAEYDPSHNPYKIKDQEKLDELLTKVQTLEPILVAVPVIESTEKEEK